MAGERNRDRLTKQPAQMLGAVHVSNAFTFPLSNAVFPHLSDFEKLLTLEAVEKDPSQALFKILSHARHHLFEQIRLRRPEPALTLFFVKIRGQNLVDGMGRRERDEGEILGDILPIIDKDRFQVIRHDDADRGPRVERFFLHGGIVNLSILFGGGFFLFRPTGLATRGFAARGVRIRSGSEHGFLLLEGDSGNHEHSGSVLALEEVSFGSAGMRVIFDSFVRLRVRVRLKARIF